MSMNGFFCAFNVDQMQAIEQDHRLIDEWIFEEESYVLSTDVANAWHVLSEVLDGDGFHVGEHIENALSMGCFLVYPDEVAEQAENLSHWTHDEVIENLHELNEEADLYRLDMYREDEKSLLHEFDKLVNFYNECAKNGFGIVHYVA